MPLQLAHNERVSIIVCDDRSEVSVEVDGVVTEVGATSIESILVWVLVDRDRMAEHSKRGCTTVDQSQRSLPLLPTHNVSSDGTSAIAIITSV